MAQEAVKPDYLDEPGNDLQAETLELLDFPAIRKQLADYTKFPAARELALNLTPAYDARDVTQLRQETAEGLEFLDKAQDVDLYATDDASALLDRAALGGILSGIELLTVSASVEIQRRARSAFHAAREVAPMLADIASGIPELGNVQSEINSAIGPRGEVVDSATPSLGILRRQARDAYQRVTEALERVIGSSEAGEALQDNVISMRSERLVVQVKTEQRQKVRGIVHDASNTGATLFIEPFATVELCNTWRELVLEEQRETARVLSELSELVGEVAADTASGAELTARLDFILARARYSAKLNGVAPLGAGADDLTRDDSGVRLLRARHPLLGDQAVPVTIHMDPERSVLVITGPNTGGKTVAMKTVGLLALMSQSGLHIAAGEGSVLPIFGAIYADVGDQQSIQGSVSTFGSHMRNVIAIIERASDSALVLLDELGTSTDPEEGSALAKAILAHLASEKVKTIVTTHHRSVAAYAETSPGMMNASVDLDPETLMPTYQLTMGIPGRSYAMSVASQLGLPEAIMDEAQSLLEPQYLRFEDWLNELQSERDQLKIRLQNAQESEAQAEATKQKLEAELDELEARRADILHSMRAQLSGQFGDVTKKLRRAEAALSWDAPSGEPVSREVIDRASAELASAEEGIKELERRAATAPRVRERQPLTVGALVDVQGLNVQGKVMSVDDHGGDVEVSVGGVRFRLDPHRLTQSAGGNGDEADNGGVEYDLGPMIPNVELHLRGLRSDDATFQVEDFLDKALRDGVSTVRIVHGKGTGALRLAVRELLQGHRLVKSFASAPREKGGSGVTVVELM